MANADHSIFRNFSGSLNNQITFKNYKGKTVVCAKIQKRQKPASAAQKKNEEIFSMANDMAKDIYDDPVEREAARLRLNVPHGNALYRAILKECRMKILEEKNG